MRCSIQSVSSSNLCRQSIQVPYVCFSCRHQALRQRNSRLQTIRNVSSGLPFTERLRRKIWGTDNPPGLKDPYGPSYFERKQQESRAKRESIDPSMDHLETDTPESPPSTLKTQNMKKSNWLEEVCMHDPVREDSSYLPAETWDGLPRVGTSQIGHERRRAQAHSFQPFFSAPTKATTREKLLPLMHQAIVEVVTVNDAMPPGSRDLGQIYHTPGVMAAISHTVIDPVIIGEHITLKYQDGHREEIIEGIKSGLDRVRNPAVPEAQDAEVETQHTSARGNDGGHHVQNETGDDEGSNDFSGADNSRGTTDHPESTERSSHTIPSASFLRLPMHSFELRFSIIKRLSQLVGHRIPDPVLTTSKTLMPIYTYLLRSSSPKAEKLADALLKKKDLVNLPNVHIMARRETPIDKDKRLGRWKVIEAELQRKGLPVLSNSRV